MKTNNEKSFLSKKTEITMLVFLIAFAVTAIVMTALYAVNMNELKRKGTNLENVYQRTFYDLVDNVNNTEIKLSKLIVSSDDDYSENLLSEISQNLTNAQNQLSYLPISANGIPEITRFVNQLSGYTSSLSKKVKSGKSLTAAEKTKLREIYGSISDMKYKINILSTNINDGYKLSDNVIFTREDYNKLTTELQGLKEKSVDYPTMIYDGPFSESTMNKEIKGLNFAEISEEKAFLIAENLIDGTQKVTPAGEANGKFVTYDFNIYDNDGIQYYAQITKKGGKLLSMSGRGDRDSAVKTIDEAKQIALNFAKKLGIENMQCVWYDKIQNDVYLNLAPVLNDIVIYPDLIKVKVDLATGKITGYEASTYYTNHTSRNLLPPRLPSSVAQNSIDSKYQVETIKLSLSPIEFEEETLTWEFKCRYRGDTYYIYINANNGNEENILRVVETENGNLLM